MAEVREFQVRVMSAALVEIGPGVILHVGVERPVGVQRRRRVVGVIDEALENRTCDVDERGDIVTGDLNLASCWTLIPSSSYPSEFEARDIFS